MSETITRFGRHTPTSQRTKGAQSPMAIFTLGLSLAPGTIWRFDFPNGYGASVINDGYGHEQGLYELAVVGPDGKLNYDTPVTSDVLGWLSEDAVAEALDQIEALPRAEA